MTVHCTISVEVNVDGYEAGVEGSEHKERESTSSTPAVPDPGVRGTRSWVSVSYPKTMSNHWPLRKPAIKPSQTAKDYFVSSNSNDLINLSSINKKWILKSGFDLSSCFLKRRNGLVNSCSDCAIILKPDEELSINGIILLDDDADSNAICFDRYEEACNEVKERYSKYEEDDIKSNVDEVYQFSKSMSKGNFNQAEDEVNASKLPSHIKAILYSFKQTYCKGYTIKTVNESTTVKDGIFPFLENYLPNSKRYTTFGTEQRNHVHHVNKNKL
ncbi:unnamed protein product [Mucor hiemalis]